MSFRDHWSVTSRQYSGDGVVRGPHTVTEFDFSNDVQLHYREQARELEISLPVHESIYSTGRSEEEVGNDQIGVRLIRMQGVLCGIVIYSSKEET